MSSRMVLVAALGLAMLACTEVHGACIIANACSALRG